MAMHIQQEVYQAVYDIHVVGPDNFGLAIGLTYPNMRKMNTVPFGITRDGREDQVDVVLTCLRCTDGIGGRTIWKFEGILWNQELHAKKEDNKRIRARVKGTYDSRARTGRLYVLAHEQPKPLAEAITWEDLAQRFAKPLGCVVEFKCRTDGALQRAGLDSIFIRENLLRVKRLELDCPRGYDWKYIGSGAHYFNLTDECSLPLVLTDGRVVFSAKGIDYTIYQPNASVDYC